MELAAGLTAQAQRVVTEDDTAIALGSGDVPVLATPRLIAWLESATVAALAGRLAPGATSVGTHIDVQHRAPSPVGAVVTVSAELSEVEGALLRFEVVARAGERVLATGRVVRAVVERDRFLRSR